MPYTDCAAVLDANPRTTYLPGESSLLFAYLARGGAAILMYDLGFVLEARLTAGLKKVGVVVEPDVVIDPLDHYSTDPEVVAVPVYERHPITRNVALTLFPGIRSVTLLAPGPASRAARSFSAAPRATRARSSRWRSASRGAGAQCHHRGAPTGPVGVPSPPRSRGRGPARPWGSSRFD